jgi:RNA polymerase sigma factor (sigma-70 family)
MESGPVDELLPTRQSLLGRLKNWDDQESWRDFFYTYWKLIYSVAVKSGLDDMAAQDVVQETVLAVAKSIRDFEYDSRNGSFKSWLLTITRRRVTDHWRRKYAQPIISQDFESGSETTPLLHRHSDPNVSWQTMWDQEWDRNLLEVALENVKPKVKARQYQLFDCLVLKEWPLAEIKQKLHASLAQIYFAKYKVGSLLQRELRQLRRRWEERDGRPNCP